MQGAKIAGASKIIAVDRLEAKLELARSRRDRRRGCILAGDRWKRSRHRRQRSGLHLRGRRNIPDDRAGVCDDTTRRDDCSRWGRLGYRRGHLQRVGPLPRCEDAHRCVYGSTDPDRDFPVLVEMIERGAIDARALVTKRIGLEDINDALDSMEAGVGARSLVVFE